MVVDCVLWTSFVASLELIPILLNLYFGIVFPLP
jgi:hypothetical protein